MYISAIAIENFRNFGSGSKAFRLPLKPGLTALVGENDAGKTAVTDALNSSLAHGTKSISALRRRTFIIRQAVSRPIRSASA